MAQESPGKPAWFTRPITGISLFITQKRPVAGWSLYHDVESFRTDLILNLRPDLVDLIADSQGDEPKLASNEIAERLLVLLGPAGTDEIREKITQFFAADGFNQSVDYTVMSGENMRAAFRYLDKKAAELLEIILEHTRNPDDPLH